MSQRVLITGGAGYVGSVAVGEMLRAGHSVTVLDNFMFGQTPLLEWIADERLRVVRGDARNRDLLRGLVADADTILPLACLTGAPLCDHDPTGARSVIIDALESLLGLLGRDQRVLYPTTNSGYGIGQESIHCHEETPLRPISLYGQLKVEAEKRILDRGNGITFRLATAFGISPRMRLDLLVNEFTWRAVNDRFIVLFEAHHKRNFIHVRDIAGAFLHGLDHFEAMKDEPYNVGLDDANLSKLELCEMIRREIPEFVWTEAQVGEDPDKRNYIVSNEKIGRTGFKPRVSLQQGIAELVRGYAILDKRHYSNVYLHHFLDCRGVNVSRYRMPSASFCTGSGSISDGSGGRPNRKVDSLGEWKRRKWIIRTSRSLRFPRLPKCRQRAVSMKAPDPAGPTSSTARPSPPPAFTRSSSIRPRT